MVLLVSGLADSESSWQAQSFALNLLNLGLSSSLLWDRYLPSYPCLKT